MLQADWERGHFCLLRWYTQFRARGGKLDNAGSLLTSSPLFVHEKENHEGEGDGESAVITEHSYCRNVMRIT